LENTGNQSLELTRAEERSMTAVTERELPHNDRRAFRREEFCLKLAKEGIKHPKVNRKPKQEWDMLVGRENKNPMCLPNESESSPKAELLRIGRLHPNPSATKKKKTRAPGEHF